MILPGGACVPRCGNAMHEPQEQELGELSVDGLREPRYRHSPLRLRPPGACRGGRFGRRRHATPCDAMRRQSMDNGPLSVTGLFPFFLLGLSMVQCSFDPCTSTKLKSQATRKSGATDVTPSLMNACREDMLGMPSLGCFPSWYSNVSIL